MLVSLWGEVLSQCLIGVGLCLDGLANLQYLLVERSRINVRNLVFLFLHAISHDVLVHIRRVLGVCHRSSRSQVYGFILNEDGLLRQFIVVEARSIFLNQERQLCVEVRFVFVAVFETYLQNLWFIAFRQEDSRPTITCREGVAPAHIGVVGKVDTGDRLFVVSEAEFDFRITTRQETIASDFHLAQDGLDSILDIHAGRYFVTRLWVINLDLSCIFHVRQHHLCCIEIAQCISHVVLEQRVQSDSHILEHLVFLGLAGVTHGLVLCLHDILAQLAHVLHISGDSARSGIGIQEGELWFNLCEFVAQAGEDSFGLYDIAFSQVAIYVILVVEADVQLLFYLHVVLIHHRCAADICYSISSSLVELVLDRNHVNQCAIGKMEVIYKRLLDSCLE